MITTTDREGWINRHTHGMPEGKCIIQIIHNDTNGENIYKCRWFSGNGLDGYLGTAIKGRGNNIGWHAIKDNDSEFVYYKLI